MLAFSHWLIDRKSVWEKAGRIYSHSLIVARNDRMASLGLHLLTVLLGMIFLFLGHIKITPQFFPEYHNQIRNEFGKFNKEFPLYQLTGWRPYAKNYRIAVGVIEMSAGSLLLLAGGKQTNRHWNSTMTNIFI